MNLHRASREQPVAQGRMDRLGAGYTLLSMGILLATAGGSWDISNHLLNKPETFFAPPHAVLYAGVSVALAGAAVSWTAQKGQRSKFLKISVAGVIALVVAGPVDFAWHSAFGLDGLMSPPHTVLVMGMVAVSAGACAAAAIELRRRSLLSLTIGALPVWLSATGLVYLLILPFSKTAYFDFNPNPSVAMVIASVALPFLTAGVLFAAFALSGRRFGAISTLGSAFLAVGTLSSVAPNSSLYPALPFYAMNLLPIVASDALACFGRSRYAMLAAGAILGFSFLSIYFPLITYTLNAAVMPARLVWPSLVAPVYFDMLPKLVLPVAVPAAVAGILGSVAALRLEKKVL